jgi:hypothetical protein
MDLIDASNAPTPVTHDPITGNPIVGNTTQDVDMNTSEDTSGSTAEPMSDLSTHITMTTPTVYPFENLNRVQQSGIIRLSSEITNAWDVVSPATPFPYRYHPDPDVRNWGHALMTGLSRLAQMSSKGLQRQAVQHVLDHLQERNEGKFDRSLISLSLLLRSFTNKYHRPLSSRRRPCSPPRGHPVRHPPDGYWDHGQLSSAASRSSWRSRRSSSSSWSWS